MASVDVTTLAGKKAGSAKLPEQIFGIEPNLAVMHQVVTAQLAARRAGTHSTKTRAERRGGGAKPWRQKGTGRARQGSIRSPQWRGGGIAHGPKPRDYSQKTPKKMIKLALASALSDRAADGKVVVIDSFDFDVPKTALAVKAINDLGLSEQGRILVVLSEDDVNAALSFRNVANVHVLPTAELNAYDVLVSDTVVFAQGALPEEPMPKRERKAPKPKPAAQPPAAKAEEPAEKPASDKSALAAALNKVKAAANEAPAAETQVADAPATDDAADFGPGSHAPLPDDSMPEGFPIKGNADSMKFHQPDGRWYEATVAEVWFADVEAAVAAGFIEAGTKAASTEEEPSAPDSDDGLADANASEEEE